MNIAEDSDDSVD